jgi:RNA polymerase sigma-70 factor (ECF subfamily)
VNWARRAKFETLFKRHYGSLLAYALRRTGLEEAEDVVAETFLTAWRRFEDLPGDPLPWLYGVARRIMGNHWRTIRRRQALDLRLRQRWSSSDAGSSNDPMDEAVAHSAILSAFAQLSDGDREVLSLIAWEGLSSERAAAALNISPATFAVRLHRARRRLAKRLEDAEWVSEASGA